MNLLSRQGRPMGKIARRFLVLLVLMFWQGGFMFYGAVVVTVGTEVLGSHLQQGLITQRVTNYLNLAGLLALAVCAGEIAWTEAASPTRRLRWLTWFFLLLAHGWLLWLHLRLDELIDGETILDPTTFKSLHRWYLNLSTFQWATSMAFLGTTLWTWKNADARMEK